MGFGSIGKALGKTPLAKVSPLGIVSNSSSLKDMLLGKKSEGSAEKFSALNPEQQQALGLYSEGLKGLQNFNPMEQSKLAILNQERMARSGIGDAERQAKELVSQRGLNRSAAGISAILGVGRGMNDKLQAIRAQQPLLQQQLEGEKLNRLGGLSGGINAIYDTRMYTPAVQGGVRQGGILGPLLSLGGAGAGAYYGGPQGAAAGYQTGAGLGKVFQNY